MYWLTYISCKLKMKHNFTFHSLFVSLFSWSVYKDDFFVYFMDHFVPLLFEPTASFSTFSEIVAWCLLTYRIEASKRKINQPKMKRLRKREWQLKKWLQYYYKTLMKAQILKTRIPRMIHKKNTRYIPRYHMI